MIRTTAALLLSGCVGIASAAPGSLLGRYLSAAQRDSLVAAQRGHVTLLERTPGSIPFIGDAEFRIRNRALDFGGQRYTLKLEPRGIGETKALHEYRSAQIGYEETLTGYILNRLLLDRYIFFIDMLERKSLADGYRELIPVYEDRIKVMEQLKSSADFDLTRLIKVEKDLAKMISENIEESQEVATANNYIWSLVGDSLSGGIDTAGLVSVKEIKKVLANTHFTLDENNIYFSHVKKEFEFSEKRYKVEKAQSRKVVSFIDFSFDFGSYNDEVLREHLGREFNQNNAYIIELGVKLPFFTGAREDLVRRQIDFMKDREESVKLNRELAAKMKKDEADMRAYIERYELLTARETEADAEASLKKYLQMSGVDPLVLLEIKEDLIKNRMEKEKMYFSILRNYVYIMDVTGQLIREPRLNYLSATREALAP